MTQIFSSTRGRRRVFVDEDGIHEERRGQFTRFIAWSELAALNRLKARSTGGTRIRIDGLSPRGKCYESISNCWKDRYTEAWKKDRRQSVRALKHALYFKLPAVVLAFEGAGYAFFRLAPWPSDT